MENIGIHTESNKASVITAPIKFDLSGQCFITVDYFTNTANEAVYRVQTTDYVINEWNEYFATLSLALMRVATLTACIEFEVNHEGESLAFVNDPSVFADHAHRFINEQVK